MPYITREDGEHFVIPSYRDVLSAKNKNALKKQILLLSESYGEYIAMQAKGTTNYEVAFSQDTGYLLGETVWDHFGRPEDLIYCEAIPDTSEAILVVVKSGSVYLDGSFSMESIADELVIFLTQENHFDIYIHGDVPISEFPEEGKFAFDADSINAFKELDDPLFNKLPLLPKYQLQLVETALKKHGIGVLPIKPIVIGIAFLGLAYMMYAMFLTAPPKPVQQQPQVNPFQAFYDTLKSPAPEKEMRNLVDAYTVFYTMPGWDVKTVKYSNGSLIVDVETKASSVASLSRWAKKNDIKLNVTRKGFELNDRVVSDKRPEPKHIYKIDEVIAEIIDRVKTVNPGNTVKLKRFNNRRVYRDVAITVSFSDITPSVLKLIGEQFKGLPVVLQDVDFKLKAGTLSGNVNYLILGS